MWTFVGRLNRRYQITKGQYSTWLHGEHHVYIVSNTILQAIHFSENGISVSNFWSYPSQSLCPRKMTNFKQTNFDFFWKSCGFFFISGKMASFLVRKYSENDVQVISILNVQSTFRHNVQPTIMIRYIQYHTSKRHWDSKFKELVY